VPLASPLASVIDFRYLPAARAGARQEPDMSKAAVQLSVLSLALALSLAACAKEAPAAASQPAPAAPAGDKKVTPPTAIPNPPVAGQPAAQPTPAAAPATPTDPNLLDPSKAKEQAPATFKVKYHTTKGDITVAVTRDWSPNGADRLYNLVKIGYYKDIAYFRVVPGFMAQFGIHGDPAVNKVWRTATLPDDPVKQSNKKGFLTFAKTGAPNSRSVQFFLNLVDNANLDGMGFAPIGQIVEGLDVLEKINSEYGEGAPRGRGPDQGRVQQEGNAYLKKDFPRMDYIVSAEIL